MCMYERDQWSSDTASKSGSASGWLFPDTTDQGFVPGPRSQDFYPMSQLPNICTAHPGTSTRPRPDSWLVSATHSAHFVVRHSHEWRHEWQHGGFCPLRHSFGCVLLLNQIFRKQCTIRQYTTLIYLINLLWKLGLGLGLDSELHYFGIFMENKKNEHLIFCECHGR